MGPTQKIPKLTPKVGPNQFPQLISHNGTQFGAREQHNINMQLKPKFSQKLEMGQRCIYQKRAVYSKIWQHHNVLLKKPLKIASKITKIGPKMAKKTSLKISQNQAHKKGSGSRCFSKITSNGDSKSLSELTNTLSSKNLTTLPFESPKSVERWERDEGLKFGKCGWFSAIYCRKSAIIPKIKTPTGCSELVRNPVHANEICNHTKFDIPYSMAQSKFPSEVISIKSGSHFQKPF